MEFGKVKFFSAEKGWGYIMRDAGGDCFVHHSQIMADGFRTLEQGDRVSFDVVSNEKGLNATSVYIINEG